MMKRYLTYLLLITCALFLQREVARADNTWTYYYLGEANNWDYTTAMTGETYKIGSTSNAKNQITWTIALTGAQLDCYNGADGKAYFAILVKYNDDTSGAYRLGPNAQDKPLILNSGSLNLASGSAYKNNSMMVDGIIQEETYTIKFVSNPDGLEDNGRNFATVSISGERSTSPITLRSNVYTETVDGKTSWIAKAHDYDVETELYSWTMTREDIEEAGLSNGDRIDFKLEQGGTWYGTNAEIGNSISANLDIGGNNNNCYFFYNSDYAYYTILAKPYSNTWRVMVVENIEEHDYYWVSPQVTNNQKLESYKLVAYRNRSRDGDGEDCKFGDGKVSNRYYGFTVKDDDLRGYDGATLAANAAIDWYIVRDDNQVWYRPEAGTTLTVDAPQTHDTYVKYQNYNSQKRTDASQNGLFQFNKGLGKSYTFILNAIRGHVSINYAVASAPTNVDYELIGNFTSAKGSVDITFTSSKSMAKLWYKGGDSSESEIAGADSIVYTVTVNKPELGWGDLYIDVNQKGNTTWAAFGSEGVVYRPVVSIKNNLDGRALMGGLMAVNYDQSLNPVPSDDYTSYTFRFNATTMTYRLEFHTSLYLVGPAVSATQRAGSWDISNVETTDPRIQLTPTQDGHYRNYVYMTQGCAFRFLKNVDEGAQNYRITWGEDANAPLWTQATEESQRTPGNDTQYRNNLLYVGDGSTSSTSPGESGNILFDLPTGWYYINFYNNDGETPYYTIERQLDMRDFEHVHYSSGSTEEDRVIEGRNGYEFFRVWSDHIAWNKPDDIDVYIVSQFAAPASTGEKATITLQRLDAGYIPAQTGVILTSRTSRDNLLGGQIYKTAESGVAYNTLWADMTPYSAPATTELGEDVESRLTPLYEATNLQRYESVDGEEYANYLFGFYRKNLVTAHPDASEYSHFLLGFWMTTGVGNTYSNSAFLRLTLAECAKIGVGTSYDYNLAEGSAPCFLLVFDDDHVISAGDGGDPSQYGNGATAVSEVTTAGRRGVSDAWYTLEGTRLAASPTARGIYVHQGRKVVVR